MMRKSVKREVGVLLVALTLPSFAHAYLDPGTGSALIQGLIAAIAAIGVTLKLYWHRFLALFNSDRKEELTAESHEENDKL